MRALKALVALILLLIVAGGVLWITAPRETWPTAVAAPEPGADLDAWLAARESVFDDLTPGTEKTVVWAGEPGQRTPVALVYLHGFSATRQEINPVAERIASEVVSLPVHPKLSQNDLEVIVATVRKVLNA